MAETVLLMPPPPPGPLAELPESVELETVRVPALKMPPPPDPPKLEPLAELPEMVQLETVRVPALSKAPPLSVVIAPETITPEIERFPPLEIVKILKSRLALPLLPLMLRLEEPGPMMVRVPAVEVGKIVESAKLSVMVPVTPEKRMSSLVDAVFASIMACLREPGPTSLVFVTMKVDGVILSSRVMSSSLEESEDFLAFLFCEILKNLRKT